MKRIVQYFFRGLLFVVPLAVTFYVLYAVFTRLDDLLGIRLRVQGKTVPGVGFLVVLAGTTLIGFLASNFLTKRPLHLIERILSRLPFIKLIYTSLRDLTGAFVGEKKGFEKPVLVSLLPGSDVKVAGFMTNTSLDSLGMPEKAAVYVPQSYNFAGNLVIVPWDQVTPLGLESSDAMTFIVSGGIAKGADKQPQKDTSTASPGDPAPSTQS